MKTIALAAVLDVYIFLFNILSDICIEYDRVFMYGPLQFKSIDYNRGIPL